MRSVLLKFTVILFVGLCCLQTAHAQRVKAVRDWDSANILAIKKAVDLPDVDLADKLEKYPNGKSTLAESPQKTRQAFVFCVPSGSKEVASCVHRVFITDLGADETYEVTGEELSIEANRPVDSLKWINEWTLSYERWTGPHYGHRYVIEFKQKKQTGSFILTDR
jgi:hypothetical protein